MADLDLDGDLELISCNFGRATQPGSPGVIGSLTVFEQTGVGTFEANSTRLEAPSIETPRLLRVTDLDGDGEPDLIVGDANGMMTIFYGGRH